MATIKSSISLNDQMSAPIRNITEAMNMMLSSWDNLSGETARGLDIGDVEAVRSKLNQAGDQLDRMQEGQENFNREVERGSVAVSGLTGKIASMVAGIGFAKIAKDAIEFASDLNEVQNVVDVSFGSNAKIVDEWAKTTLNAFGLNELSAKQFTGTMGAMLKSSGLAGDEVVNMSMRITELAGDMASFYNLSGEEAFGKIRAGISGETEPLKQLGINMSVANLEAYALSQGMDKAYNSMSQAEQVQLRYNYLLNATADAQGDFSRTIDGFSNQQKLLQENWSALTGEIASYVLPTLALLFNIANSGIQLLSNNIEIVMPLLAGLIAIMGAYAAVHFALGAAQTFATIKQWALNNAVFACPVFWIIAGIVALIAVLVAVAGHLAKTGNAATTAFGVITGGVNVVIHFFIELWERIKSLCDNIPTAFQNAWIGAQAGFASFVSNVISGIVRIGEALNKLPFVEFDMSGLSAAADNWAAKAQDLNNSKGAYKPLSGFESGWAADAYNSGAAWGDGVVNKLKGATDDVFNGGDLAADMASTAESAGSAAKSLEKTVEDLRYMRDIAEREAINRFTTAEINVDLGGVTNNVSSGADLDGLINYLVDGVSEALNVAAEGVHA